MVLERIDRSVSDATRDIAYIIEEKMAPFKPGVISVEVRHNLETTGMTVHVGISLLPNLWCKIKVDPYKVDTSSADAMARFIGIRAGDFFAGQARIEPEDNIMLSDG